MKGAGGFEKYIENSVLIIFCTVLVGNVSAKSLKNQSLRGNDNAVAIIKYGTEAKFHTSIWITYMNEKSIQIENTVQRKNAKGNWENKGKYIPTINHIDDDYQTNFNISSTADTRAIWVNITSENNGKRRFIH